MFGGGREKQRQYSSVSTEEGHREGPEVRLNNFWPIMLMVFIGVMTLPTLIVSAVTLARVPEACDLSGITASLDKDSKNMLNGAASSLSNSATSIGTHASTLGTAASTIASYGTTPVKTAAGTLASGSSSNPATVCAHSSTSHTSPTILQQETFLIGHDASSTPMVLAKICPAQCAAVSHVTVFFLETTADLHTTNPPEMQTLKLNPHTGVVLKERALFSESDTDGKTTVTISAPCQSSLKVAQTPSIGEDEYTLGYITYTVEDSTDQVDLNSVHISFRETYSTAMVDQHAGMVSTQIAAQQTLVGANLQILSYSQLSSQLSAAGIAIPSTSSMACPT